MTLLLYVTALIFTYSLEEYIIVYNCISNETQLLL